MQIYKTNSGLVYNQYAYLLKTKDGFLIIDTIGCYNNYYYQIGSIIPIDEIDDIELEETKYDLKKSSLYNDYLFNELINKELTLEDIIKSTKLNQKYYILEKTNKENKETNHIYSLDKEFLVNILEQENNNKNREHSYRMFYKNKEGLSFLNELSTMNKMELISWLG